MEITVGTILDGKVKSIAKFGAFIALEDGKTGLVHISEVAHTFVNDIHDHLQEGQDVKVKVIAIEPNGRINLSIKQTQEREKPAFTRAPARSTPNSLPRRPSNRFGSAAPMPAAHGSSANVSFEEKLKAFMSESDNKIAGIKQYSDHKTKSRRR